MSKVLDITDKLSFDTNPVIVVKGEELEVHSDAATVIKIIGLFNGEKSELEASTEAIDLLFSKKDKEKIKNLNLLMKDYKILIQEAVNLAVGDDDSEGEEQTHTTT